MATIGGFAGIPARKMKPTKQHVPALWECMLGTLYARNPATGEIKYFGYDWKAAYEHAGLVALSRKRKLCSDEPIGPQDARVYRAALGWYYPDGPSKGKLVLWVKEQAR